MIKNIWTNWKRLAERTGSFQAVVVFSVLYFVLIVPMGLLSNLYNDYLRIKKFPEWEDYELNSGSMKDIKGQ